MTKRSARTVLSHNTRLLALLASTALVHSTAALAQSLPTGGQVAAGSATIGAPANGALTITQTSGSAVVNWQRFNVGKGNRVTFAQPDANAAILNRVTGDTTSTIAGQISANGQVYLVNPNGIAITGTGTVKAGGFVASTLGISDDDFMAGKRTFSGNGASAPVNNAGSITINRGGYMALIGGVVGNSGTITVPLGKAALGSGEQATLDLSGDGFLQVAVPTKAGGKDALVSNIGKISARGGTVQLSAAAAKDMARQAVNMSGTIEATGVSGKRGDITLTGDDGDVSVSGTLDAGNSAAKGGNVTVTGRKLTLTSAKVDASGKTGGGTVNIGGGRQGKGPLKHAETLTVDAKTAINANAITVGNGGSVVLWSDDLTSFAGEITAKGGARAGNGGEAEVSGKALLSYTGFTDLSAANGSFGNLLLDPYNVTISSGTDSNSSGFTASDNDSVINVNTLTSALATANVTVATGTSGSAGSQTGNITVAAPISWSSGSTLTLSAANAITLDDSINVGGAGGVSLIYDSTSPTNLSFASGASIDYGATNQGGSLTVNGQSYALVYSMADLAAISTGGKSALATDLFATTDGTASGTATAYTGSIVPTFSGTFEGLGHSVSDLNINSTTANANVGLFGLVSSGTIRDIALIGGSVTGADNTGTGGYVGALVGLLGTGSSQASVVNASASTTVLGGAYATVGGLVGEAKTDRAATLISNSFATGAVTAGTYGNAGGLVGFNNATGGTATITGSYATGAVNEGAYGSAGGLTAYNYAYSANASITTSYATGVVTGGANATLGGLVGQNYARLGYTASITDAYATGNTGSSNITAAGGLVGTNTVSQGYTLISNVYATGAVFGGSMNGGLVGESFASTSSGTSVASITNAYATGAVQGPMYSNNGGLVGYLSSYGSNASVTVANAYSTGSVTAPSAFATYAGGSIGWDVGQNGGAVSLSNLFWDSETSGRASGIGNDGAGQSSNVTGLTTALARSASNYTGFDFANVWYQTGDMRPILRSEAATADTNGIATISNLHQLALIGTNLSGSYVLGADIDASDTAGSSASGIWSAASGWVPIGPTSGFSGTFDGDGHVIWGLTLNAAGYAGLFDTTTGSSTIKNVGVTNANVTGTNYYAGILVGNNGGTISNAYVSGTVSGDAITGGLVGENEGTITLSHATSTVAGGYTYSFALWTAGGLVGINDGTISQSYATGNVSGEFEAGGLAGENSGTISQSYATGSVSGQLNGGLVGRNYRVIQDAYATGAVSGSQGANGGLVGRNFGLIQNSYAIGAVSRGLYEGGLVAIDTNGSYSQSFWDTETTGQLSSSGGGTGLTHAQMTNPFTFIDAGWDFTGSWAMLKAGGSPVLRSLTTDPVYDYYVRLSGDTSSTYGDAASTSGITADGIGASNVTVGFGSAVGATTNAGTYAYSGNVLALTYSTGSSSDYYVDYGSDSLTIDKRAVTVTANSGQSFVYGNSSTIAY
ncbi:MAG: filamentous hemagglutinin N-terminal domain-containing protein, partial [Rhizobiaceae bacterium]|nr:filamentous hemagglutinin N-terminal domain-containing protein [Rhizobiaceae bacterium]